MVYSDSAVWDTGGDSFVMTTQISTLHYTAGQ